MTRPAHDDEDDADLDPEGPDPHEMDYSDEPDLAICPHCRKMIFEDAERCPHCGEYVLLSETPLNTRGWLVIAVIVALLIAMLFWLL